jgi:hypothetical protein
MKIEIIIEHGVRNKEKIIIIKDIRMLPRNKLPYEYIHEGESVMKHQDSIYYFNNTCDMPFIRNEFMKINDWYHEDFFIERTETIKRCAKRLGDINKKLEKELRESGWELVEKRIYI